MVTARQGGWRQTSEQVTVTADVHLNKETITDSEAKRVDDGGKYGRDNPDLEDTAVSDKKKQLSEDDAGRVLVRSKDGNIAYYTWKPRSVRVRETIMYQYQLVVRQEHHSHCLRSCTLLCAYAQLGKVTGSVVINCRHRQHKNCWIYNSIGVLASATYS